MSWIRNHKFLFFLFFISFFLIILGFLLVFLNLYQNDVIIIKYIYRVGILKLGNFYDLILFFITSLIICGLNFILAKRFEEYDKFLAKFISVLNLIVCILIFIYFMSIIGVN